MPAPAPAPGAAPGPPAPPDPGRLDQLEGFLAELAAALEPASAPRRGRGRPAALPSLLLWAGLVVCVLRGWSSQRALWRLLAGTGLWHYPRVPVCDEAVRQRLAADPAQLPAFFAQVTALLAARVPPR